MQENSRDRFDWSAFLIGLGRLDEAIGTSSFLRQFAPISIIASGGFASLTALGNRTTTQDLDYFIDPVLYGDKRASLERALKFAIATIGFELHYDPKWCNDDVSMFLTLLNNPQDLFRRSVEQNVVLYRGTNLIIYAVLWKWVLVRKMKRLQMEGQEQRDEDVSDCIAILRLLTVDGTTPLRKAELLEFDHTEREPPVLDTTIEQINNLHRQSTAKEAFAE